MDDDEMEYERKEGEREREKYNNNNNNQIYFYFTREIIYRSLQYIFGALARLNVPRQHNTVQHRQQH